MRTYIIAGAGALFLAPVVTEISMRLWPGQYLQLLLLTFVALFVNALLSLRLARSLSAPAATAPGTAVPRATGGRSQGARQDSERGAAADNRDRAPARRRDSEDASAAPRKAAAASARSAPAAAAAADVADGPREPGTVKWFNRTKGFGFVIRESGEEIFVHQRSIRSIDDGDMRRRPSLRDGQRVSFVVAERDKGLQAEDVVPEEEE